MYVDINYYKDNYGGLELSYEAFNRFLIRANNDIERLTRSQIVMEKLSELDRERVKKAVCSQVEFLAIKGETASTVSDNIGSVSIGSYSESSGGRYGALADVDTSRYADAVFDWLFPTGLLFAGVEYV